MKMKRKDWGVGYNPQILTENRFILSSRVPNTAEDTGELIPSLEKLHRQYTVFPKQQLADAGYSSEESYKFLKEKNIFSYIPHATSTIKLEDYNYDQKENSYTEKKNGKKYIFKQQVSQKQE